MPPTLSLSVFPRRIRSLLDTGFEGVLRRSSLGVGVRQIIFSVWIALMGLLVDFEIAWAAGAGNGLVAPRTDRIDGRIVVWPSGKGDGYGQEVTSRTRSLQHLNFSGKGLYEF